MRRAFPAPFLFIILLVLSGCGGPGTQRILSGALPDDHSSASGAYCPPTHRHHFFAAPMCDRYQLRSTVGPYTAADADADSQTRTAFIAAALTDSRTKCEAFVALFTGEQAGENAFWDVAGLVLSGVGAAITGPASTIRALAASSTAAQGIKQTINADVFQQLTVALFVKQINLNYFQVLDNEFSPAAIAASLSAPAAYARIQALHRNCSIPFAAANLSAAQDNSQASTGSTVFALGGIPNSGATVTLTVKSTSQKIAVALTATATLGASAATMANQLAEKILATAILAQAGVLVSAAPATKDSATLTVQGGPTDLTWTASTSANAGITIKSLGMRGS
jgi:hypothetical protein